MLLVLHTSSLTCVGKMQLPNASVGFEGQCVLIGGEVLKVKLVGCRSYSNSVLWCWVSVKVKDEARSSGGRWVVQGTAGRCAVVRRQ